MSQKYLQTFYKKTRNESLRHLDEATILLGLLIVKIGDFKSKIPVLVIF